MVKRFAQHKVKQSNIAWFSFQPCKVRELDALEERLIHEAEGVDFDWPTRCTLPRSKVKLTST